MFGEPAPDRRRVDAYAADDQREQLVPLAMVDVRWEGSNGSAAERHTIFIVFASPPFSAAYARYGPQRHEQSEDAARRPGWWERYWTARRRPLTRYLANAAGPAWTRNGDVSRSGGRRISDAAAGIPESDWPCRRHATTFRCTIWSATVIARACAAYSGGLNVSFSTSPRGHTASSIASPLAQTMLYCEPLFHIGTILSPDAGITVTGWHGGVMSDNVGVL